MNVEETPIVSCIMPTYNRRAFVPHAIQYFLRQDYPQKELIIIDDGTDCIKDLVPDHPLIRYYQLNKKISLGAKLNLACGFAKGSLIAHWDDDDWYASHRLSYQVCSLQEEHIYISGINHLFYLDLEKKDAFQYIYPQNQRPWLLGSSLVYKKFFWLQNNFADINVGMDGLFVWRTTREHLCVLPDSGFAVHMIHPGNVSPKETSGSWWHDFPVAEIEGLLKDDWHTYSNGNFYKPENKEAFETDKEFKPVKAPGNTLAASTLKNIFACLVHEKMECVVDLVRNLRYHDPSSLIILYNGSNGKGLPELDSLSEMDHVFVYPHPQQAKHGYLHNFALDCMQYALDHFDFDVMTIVDSDQLLIRENYSDYLSYYFSDHPGIGLLSSDPERIATHNWNYFVASEALKEYELWKPLLESFPGGLNKFVYWTFWPSTIFSASAIRDLLKLFKENKLLQKIMKETKIWATEEVIFPTLISLLGYEIALNPCNYKYVKYKVSHTVKDIESAMNQYSVFWVHPVERILHNPLRKYIRDQSKNYEMQEDPVDIAATNQLSGLQSILQKVEKINGWLDEKEADLLITTTLKACINFPLPHCIVEIGCYQGKSTIIFASILKQFFAERKVYSVDSHDGQLGARDIGLQTYPPSLEIFKKNIAEAGISDFVEIINDYPGNVNWQQPIALLFVDGLHDYLSVSADFSHFADWVSQEAYIAFHDYADYYPGVRKFVNDLLKTGNYHKISLEKTLMIIQKK